MVEQQLVQPRRRQVWVVALFCWVLLALLLAGSVLAVPRVFVRFSRLFPDNYRHLATESIRAGDYATAEAIARRRLTTAHYDFEAVYLLAEAVAAAGRPREAADLMQETFSRARAAGGREVGARGFDDARSFSSMAKYLWQNGEYLSSGEMYRAALDAGAPALPEFTFDDNLGPMAAAALAEVALKKGLKGDFERALGALERGPSDHQAQALILESRWLEQRDRNTTAAQAMLLRGDDEVVSSPLWQAAIRDFASRNRASELATSVSQFAALGGVRLIDMKVFSPPAGGRVTSGALTLDRTGESLARIDTGVFKVTTLLLRLAGSPALGMSPVLLLHSGETELARFYLDGIQPRSYAVPLWPQGAPKSLPLKLSFVNDAFDPVTKSDRNVTVELLGLY